MSNKLLHTVLIFCIALSACTKSDSSLSTSSDAKSSPSAEQGSGQNQAGIITAGEWNDLDNWQFWSDIINQQDYNFMPAYWQLYNKDRVSIEISTANSVPVINTLVQLKKDGDVIFTTRTDNYGKAELWPALYDNATVDYSKFSIDINNGEKTLTQVIPYSSGINKITIDHKQVNNKIEIAFVVDATGSMGDELEYLKNELLDVINRTKNDNLEATIATASVFYRDLGDDYVTKFSGFTDDINTTLNFIQNQQAGGGGNFPEAVHTAMNDAVSKLQWSSNAKTRIIFLLLDAPPHHEGHVINTLQKVITSANTKGIKIIPITASGIDKETEFLMRFMAISTNGTYVFITDHSGIGNDHLEPTVGVYEVEYLNNLIVRLINKYAN